MNIVNIAKVESMANILPSNAIVFIHQCTGQLDILGHNFWDILVQPHFIASARTSVQFSQLLSHILKLLSSSFSQTAASLALSRENPMFTREHSFTLRMFTREHCHLNSPLLWAHGHSLGQCGSLKGILSPEKFSVSVDIAHRTAESRYFLPPQKISFFYAVDM